MRSIAPSPSTHSSPPKSLRINPLTLILELLLVAAPLTAQPTITQVTTEASNGTYPTGSKIRVRVHFSESVTMASNTSVKILLETGTFDQAANISAIDSKDTASAVYEVQPADYSDDLTVSLITLVSSDGKSPSITGADQALTDASIPSGKNLADLHDIRIDGVAPSAPSGLSAKAGEGSVTLTWNKNSEGDLSQYFLYKGTTYPDTKVATMNGADDITAILKAASAEDPLIADLTYYFHVTATDTFSQESTQSQIVSATPYLTPTPEAINDVSSTDSDWWNSSSQFTGWWKFQDNGTLTYECAIGSSTESLDDVYPWTYVDTDSQRTLLGLSLTEGVTYYFSVRGKDNTSRSAIGTSDGFTIDLTPPNEGVVYDGLNQGKDIDYTNTDQSIAANWESFSDELSGIREYKYSLYRTDIILPIVDRRSVGDSTSVDTTMILTLGKWYRFSIIAVDRAGNVSDIAASNGVTADLIPPVVGEIIDLSPADLYAKSEPMQTVSINIDKEDDRSWVNDSTSLAAFWWGFTDNLSGMDYYQFAILDTDSVAILDWSITETDSTTRIMSLSSPLRDEQYYHCAVRAFDVAGNVSSNLLSDGFYVDLTPPSILERSTSLLSLTDTSELSIKFTEPLSYVDLTITAVHTPQVYFDSKLAEDILKVKVHPSIVSHDTLTFLLSKLTDIHKLVTDTVELEFHAQLLGDYEGNLKVDVSDVSKFSEEWPNTDIAPVTGDPPHFYPAPDGVADIRDAMAFARMWRWSNETGDTSLTSVLQMGEPLDAKITPGGFAVILPRNAQSGEIEIQSQGSVRLTNGEISENGLFLSRRSASGKHQIINFGLFRGPVEGNDPALIFSVDDPAAEKHFSYRFFGSSGDLISSGSATFFDSPLPTQFTLHQNSPNPFNTITTIAYDIPEPTHVEIVIYDLLGSKVTTLVNKEMYPGFHSAVWNGRDDRGRLVASGMFIVQMTSSSFMNVRKMVMLK